MTETPLALIARAETQAEAIAIRERDKEYRYAELLERSAAVASALLDSQVDLNEARVAFLLPAGVSYVATQWGIWRAGGVAVPLSLSATESELQYAISDTQASCLVADQAHADRVRGICSDHDLRLLDVATIESGDRSALPTIDPSRRAMILFTSGTTSKPKGVVTTHLNIQAQIQSLVEAWQWEAADCIPLFLPLHHIHGIINILSCALWSGATVETFARFDMPRILDRVTERAFSVFMAVPTIYVKLIQALLEMTDDSRDPILSGFADMRLMVSGSAALPATVHTEWESLTGQRLLERYGMTEIGMALSNPYVGERRPGAVGRPLPGVEIRLQSEQQQVVTEEDQPGEIQVRGPCVFREYWNREQTTREAFRDGWFLTGDVAVLERGYFRIMGRTSVDIIKSGGYKLSALEIESVLLEHGGIAECAVVGVPDETWGEAVAVAIVFTGPSLGLDELRDWCRQRLSPYKIPTRLLTVDELPRNAMGKVTKRAVAELF